MPARNFEDYIIEAEHKPITLDDYAKSPATAFLRYIVGAKDAANQCLLKFKTTARTRTYTRDALDSIHIINAGLLAAIMGNFVDKCPDDKKKKYFTDEKTFIKQIRDSRNYYTHYDKSGKKHILENIDL